MSGLKIIKCLPQRKQSLVFVIISKIISALNKFKCNIIKNIINDFIFIFVIDLQNRHKCYLFSKIKLYLDKDN